MGLIATKDCLSFDGVDDYVVMPSSPDPITRLGTYTFEATIYIPDVFGANCIFNAGKGGSDRHGATVADGKLSFGYYDGSTYTRKLAVITEGVHKVAFVNDNGELNILINGDLADTTTGAGPYISSTELLYLGRNQFVTPNQFKGTIDDVRIWNYARTQAEIQRDMNRKLTGNEDGLVAYYDFSEGEGDTLHDSTPNANHGTIYGATWDYSYDVARIQGLGKSRNIFDGQLELGSIANTTGNTGGSENSLRSANFNPVQPNTEYTLSNNMDYANYVYFYDATQTFISYIPSTGINTFTTPANCAYVKFRSISSAIQNDLNVKYQLELGDTVSPFQPKDDQGFGRLKVRDIVVGTDCVEFNKDNEHHAEIINFPALSTTAVTFMAWVCQKSREISRIIQNGTGGSVSNFIGFGSNYSEELDIDRMNFYVKTSPDFGSLVYSVSTPTELNQWIFYAGVFDNGELRLYKNGTLVDSRQIDAPVIGEFQGFYFAKDGIDEDRYSDVILKDVSVWNRAVSEAEINNYMIEKPNTSDATLAGYWSMDNVADSSKILALIYEDKVNGSFIENPHSAYSVAYQTALIDPITSPLDLLWRNEFYVTDYDIISNIDSEDGRTTTPISTGLPQHIFSFDVVEAMIRQYGESVFESTDLASRIQQIKQRGKFSFRWKGSGVGKPSAPAMYGANIGVFSPNTSAWINNLAMYGMSPVADPTWLHVNLDDLMELVDDQGKIHMVVFPIRSSSGTLQITTVYADAKVYMDTEIRDYSNNGHHARLYGGLPKYSYDNFRLTPSTLYVKNYSEVEDCLSFDGVDDYVDCGNDSVFDITGDLTLESWMLPRNYADLGGIITKGQDGTWASNSYGFRFTSVGLRFFIASGSTVDFIELGREYFPLNAWTHLAGVRSGVTLRLYINGELVSEQNTSIQNIRIGTYPLMLGVGYIGASGTNFNGDIDDVRIWNYARTQAEIQRDMNRQLIGDEEGLVAYYKMNMPIDGENILYDSSPNANHGTIYGATWDYSYDGFMQITSDGVLKLKGGN